MSLTHYSIYLKRCYFLFPTPLKKFLRIFKVKWRFYFSILKALNPVFLFLLIFLFQSNRRNQKQLFNMLMILCGIITHHVSTEWMTSQIKIFKISHRYSPIFKIVDKILNWLFSSEILRMIVLRSTARSNPNHINQNQVKLLTQCFNDSKE